MPWLELIHFRIAELVARLFPGSTFLGPRRARELLGWLRDAECRRAGWPEVEAHLRGVGMSEEQAAVFKPDYIHYLHKRR